MMKIIMISHGNKAGPAIGSHQESFIALSMWPTYSLVFLSIPLLFSAEECPPCSSEQMPK